MSNFLKQLMEAAAAQDEDESSHTHLMRNAVIECTVWTAGEQHKIHMTVQYCGECYDIDEEFFNNVVAHHILRPCCIRLTESPSPNDFLIASHITRVRVDRVIDKTEKH